MIKIGLFSKVGHFYLSLTLNLIDLTWISDMV
jgi:hypothetical protein